MSANQLIIVLSLVAGVVGTGVGGLIGALIGNRGSRVMGRVLSFAGGVMVGIVCFEMLPESYAFGLSAMGQSWKSVLVMCAGVVLGILVIFGLNKLLDVLENQREIHRKMADIHHETAVIMAVKEEDIERGIVADAKAEIDNDSDSEPEFATDLTKPLPSVAEAKSAQQASQRSLLKAGIVMLLAIAFHNFPEGMAIGATGAAETSMGVLVAIMIAVHNIPEGIAIAAPLTGGGIKKFKSIVLTALAGSATVLGALIGLWVGGISDLSTGICMAVAGGAMLYVTFGEIMPQSILMEDGRMPAISTLVGIIAAAVFVFLF